MTTGLAPTYRAGTHRLVSPEATLARLQPHLAGFGITRLADVTRLDADLGLPVYMAIRPRGAVLQSSAGKGMTVAAAKVSALMESIELDVAERPDPARMRRASRTELLAAGLRTDALPEWVTDAGRYLSDEYRINWVEATDLLNGGSVWLPAGAAYFCEPSPCRTNTNGLASGNHLIEATLHGLYEVIERDAVARLVVDHRISIAGNCLVVDPASVRDPLLAPVIATIERTETKVVLLQLQSGLAVPTYWALLLNRRPFASISTLNAGFGAHLDHGVALSRALSEAVQSRLTAIHGSREDIVTRPAYARQATTGPEVDQSPAYRFFDALVPTAGAVESTYTGAFPEALATLLSLLQSHGHERVYRVDLGCPTAGISVVKLVIPSLRFEGAMI
jgi:ribosomal protein S12 methylthiotransferase accessory factor